MRLPTPLLRFLRDERGSIAVEAILIFPMLCWAYLGTFVFFDGFRAQSINVKAAYTIGDVLSRQTDYVTPNFMDGMASLQNVLVPTEGRKALRVTTFCYRASSNAYRVIWSQTRGTGISALTNATLAPMRSTIPVLADGEVAVLTESFADYAPPMDVGVQPLTFREPVVTRPRFALNNRFCWNSVNTGGTTATETCSCPAS